MPSYVIDKNPFNNIILGFVLHALGQTTNMLFSNQLFIAVFGIFGWYFIIIGYYRIAKSKLSFSFVGIYKLLFIFYLIQCIIMIIRGYTISYPYQWISTQGAINFHLFSPFYILPYLLPALVFIPIKYYDFKFISKASIFFSIVLLFVFIIYFNKISLASTLSQKGFTDGNYGFGGNFIDIYVPFSFIVLCKKYVSLKTWIINCIGLFIAILITLISARRGGSAILALLFLFNIILFIKSQRGSKKIISIILCVFFILVSIDLFFTSDKFSYIRDRGMEDNRTGVDKELISQMDEKELIFGKGLNGRYYYPLFEDDYLNGWRYGSETGFYNIVLKGGYVMVYTYIILLLWPALLGIFNSRNLLSKAFGFYIILSLIELYPFGWLTFNIKFVIIWIGVRLCMSKTFRQLNNYQIKNYLFRT